MPQRVTDPRLIKQLQDAYDIMQAGGDPRAVMASDDYKRNGLGGAMQSVQGSRGSSFFGGMLRTPLNAVNQALEHGGNAVRHMFQNDATNGAFGDNSVAYSDVAPKVQQMREAAAREQRGRGGTDYTALIGSLFTPMPGGAGGIIARSAEQGAAASMLQPVDPGRDNFLAAKLGQGAEGAGAGALFGLPLAGLSRLGSAAAARAAGGNATKDVISAADRLGLTHVGMAQATEGNAIGRLTNLSNNMPLGSAIKRGAEGTQSELEALRNNIADQAVNAGGGGNQVLDKFGTGVNVKRGLNRSVDNFQSRADDLYDEVSQHTAKDAPFVAPGFLMSLQGRSQDFSPSMQAMGELLRNPRLKSMFDTMFERDPEGQILGPKKMTFQDAQNVRSEIGRMMGDNEVINNIPRRELSKVYASISNDMQNHLQETGNTAGLKAFNTATRYWRFGRQRIDNVLAPIIDGSPEQAVDRIKGFITNNAQAAKQVRQSLHPDEWDSVSGHIFRNLGEATPANQGADASGFSVGKFLTDFNKLRQNPTAFNWAFGGTRYEKLAPIFDDMATVAERLKKVDKLGNPSGSGYVGGMAGAVGAGAVNPLFAVKLLGANWAFSHAMASPKFARAYLSTMKAANAITQGGGRMARFTYNQRLARLPAIAGQEAGQDIGQAVYRHFFGNDDQQQGQQ